MKLGLVTYNIARDWDLPTVIHNCHTAGFAGVELRATHAHGVEPDLDKAQRREVRQRFTDSGLTLWGLGTICDFHFPDPTALREHIDSCKRYCELAQDTGARGVKVRPNYLPPEVPIETTIAQIASALNECAQTAQEHGVELWLEVHGRESQHPPYIRQMIDQCPHENVSLCWNSNPTDLLNGDVRPYFDLLSRDIHSCHIHDLWSDAYPYRELFALLKAISYDGFTLCEVGTPLDPEAGLLFMQCYRGLWHELAQP